MTPVHTPALVQYLCDVVADEIACGPSTPQLEDVEIYADPWIQDVYLMRVSSSLYYLINLGRPEDERVEAVEPVTWPPTALGEAL